MKQVRINLGFIEELRKKNGYSNAKMAEELGYKTPTGYWLLEKGERKISVDTLYRLSKLFNVSIEELLVEEE